MYIADCRLGRRGGNWAIGLYIVDCRMYIWLLEIGFVLHNGGWESRRDAGGTGELGSFRIFAGQRLGLFRIFGSVGRWGWGKLGSFRIFAGERLGSFRIFWSVGWWGWGKLGSFHIFCCWLCGIGFVSRILVGGMVLVGEIGFVSHKWGTACRARTGIGFVSHFLVRSWSLVVRGCMDSEQGLGCLESVFHILPPGWFAVPAPMLREHYTRFRAKNQAFIGWNEDFKLCGDMRDDGGGNAR